MCDLYPYKEICQDYFAQYIYKFADAKLLEVRRRILKSDSISGLISRSKNQMKKPPLDHFIYLVSKINYFLFSKNKTVYVSFIITYNQKL